MQRLAFLAAGLTFGSTALAQGAGSWGGGMAGGLLFYFVVAIFCLIWGAKASSALLNPKYPRGLLLISLTVGACCAYIFASQVDCSQTIPRERCQEIEPLLVGGFSFVCGFLGTSVVLKIFLSLLYDD